VAQLDVLFRDSIGDLEKNRENVTNSEAEVWTRLSRNNGKHSAEIFGDLNIRYKVLQVVLTDTHTAICKMGTSHFLRIKNRVYCTYQVLEGRKEGRMERWKEGANFRTIVRNSNVCCQVVWWNTKTTQVRSSVWRRALFYPSSSCAILHIACIGTGSPSSPVSTLWYRPQASAVRRGSQSSWGTEL
jgi:hypothetical protein